MRFSAALAFALATTAVTPAFAQERTFNFALGGGVSDAPEYPGSDSYSAGPALNLTFGALKWGGLSVGNGIGAVPDNGLSLRGAFRVIGSRSVLDNPELAGLRDIDTTVELGLGVTYRETNWLAFAEARRGFGGHEGISGTIGADFIMRPNDRLTINAGPRLNLGNRRYASTYFGVTADEALTSSFAAFDAEGGVLGAGVEISANYELNEKWALSGALAYEKLVNDAGDSPITQLGSDDQWTLRIGLSRAFTLRF